MNDRRGVVGAAVAAVETQLQIVLLASTVPVGHVAAAEIDLAALAHTLREVHLEALAGAHDERIGGLWAVERQLRDIGKGKEALSAVAIGGQAQVGAGTRHAALVIQAVAAPTLRRQARDVGAGVGDIRTYSTEGCIERRTGQAGLVVLGHLHTTQQGHAVADAACVRAFGKAQCVLRHAGVAQLACGNAEPLAAFAQRLRHRRERHDRRCRRWGTDRRWRTDPAPPWSGTAPRRSGGW
ncbi:hypothetical protein G6F59_014143 [Rhizopus arrhizus]|nr:hypothetical protein G6F59_014143 [Rhizopus arrhizus]